MQAALEELLAFNRPFGYQAPQQMAIAPHTPAILISGNFNAPAMEEIADISNARSLLEQTFPSSGVSRVA